MDWAKSVEGRAAPAEKKNAHLKLAKILQKTTQRQQEQEQEDKQLAAYAKVPKRIACQHMHTSLPRELRDIIYELLIPSSTVYLTHTPPYYAREMPGNAFREPFNNGRHRMDPEYTRPILSDWNQVPLPRLPEFVGHEHVGPEVLRELVETWYRVNMFNLSHPFILKRFLEDDLWGLGLDPAALITRVHLNIKLSELREIVECYVSWNQRAQMVRCIEYIFRFKPGTTITIGFQDSKFGNTVIRHWWGEGDMDDLLDCLGVIFPTLRRLRKAGYHIEAYVNAVCHLDADIHLTDEYFSPKGCLKRIRAHRDKEWWNKCYRYLQ